jgi:hypothetical protein
VLPERPGDAHNRLDVIIDSPTPSGASEDAILTHEGINAVNSAGEFVPVDASKFYHQPEYAQQFAGVADKIDDLLRAKYAIMKASLENEAFAKKHAQFNVPWSPALQSHVRKK